MTAKPASDSRILAVDPGGKRIGLALSDPTQTIAAPLTVIVHRSRAEDAQKILELARDHGAGLIVVGQALDSEGSPSLEGRKARRLAGAIRAAGASEVVLWDETGTTQAASQSQIEMGMSRPKRARHLDAMAAALILQSFLDAHRDESG